MSLKICLKIFDFLIERKSLLYWRRLLTLMPFSYFLVNNTFLYIDFINLTIMEPYFHPMIFMFHICVISPACFTFSYTSWLLDFDDFRRSLETPSFISESSFYSVVWSAQRHGFRCQILGFNYQQRGPCSYRS